MSLFCNFNGKVVEEKHVCISPANRSFRYGDGCFETMKAINKGVMLFDLHFHRLYSSLRTLQFFVPDFFTPGYLNSQIRALLEVNGHEALAKVRLVGFRGDGGLYDADSNVNFIIQSWAADVASNTFNKKGAVVDIFQNAKIPADDFSRIKSNNYLRHALAAISAKKRGLDDVILINSFGRIAESTIANVFIVSDGIIKTPPLTEGCVNGVMRKYLLKCFTEEGLQWEETPVDADQLFNSSEVFLTNAMLGIRWVEKLGERVYTNSTSSALYKNLIEPLFSQTTI